MEADTQGQPGAVAEAPPGDSTPPPSDPVASSETTAQTVEPDHAVELKDDYSNIDDWIRADAERINAEAATPDEPAPVATDEDTPTADAPPEPVAASKPAAPASKSSDFDEAAVLQRLMERGYKVEAPPPPPDPYADLTAQLTPLVGDSGTYNAVKARATAPVPAEPDQYAADYDDQMTAYRAAVKERNEAASELARLDLARSVTDVALPWAERRVHGQIGLALQDVPTKYGLDDARARRVTQPTALTDAIDAVAESLTAQWQAKLDARERYWQGEVARARTDTAAENVQRMGRQPQASPIPGGRSGPVQGYVWDTDPATGLPTEESIQRAMRGDYAHVDLSDR